MATAKPMSSSETELIRRRRDTMAVLADVGAPEIARAVESLGVLPEHEEIRTAENGLVMLRGRVGGDGAPFNLGEATVSRAAVRLAGGETGFGYVLGRDRDKARLIALCDALVQSERWRDAVEAKVVAPIRDRLATARQRKAEQVAATKVEFFTLVRGED